MVEYGQLGDTHEFVVSFQRVHLLTVDRAFVEGFYDQQ